MSSAVTWLSFILNERVTAETKVVIHATRILQFPIYYDYGDVSLDNRLDATRKLFINHEQWLNYEKSVLVFFKRLLKTPNKSEKKRVIEAFLTELLLIEEKIFSLEELKVWCRSQLEEQEMKMFFETHGTNSQ